MPPPTRFEPSSSPVKRGRGTMRSMVEGEARCQYLSRLHLWHFGQKKVERPFCTMRLTTPVQPGVTQGSPSRS